MSPAWFEDFYVPLSDSLLLQVAVSASQGLLKSDIRLQSNIHNISCSDSHQHLTQSWEENTYDFVLNCDCWSYVFIHSPATYRKCITMTRAQGILSEAALNANWLGGDQYEWVEVGPFIASWYDICKLAIWVSDPYVSAPRTRSFHTSLTRTSLWAGLMN